MDRRVSIDRLVGIYNADGSLRGELAYALGRVTGRAHCALCDITHGTFRPRPRFTELAEALPVPFELVHLDERTPALVAASVDGTPCVLAESSSGLVTLLGPDDLEECGGEPARLFEALRHVLAAHDLTWPDPPGQNVL